MQVICLEDQALKALIKEVVTTVKEALNVTQDKWISTEDAMKRLHITSKATLQKFRDEGKIRFSQPERKIILYDINSINEFLEKHAHETF